MVQQRNLKHGTIRGEVNCGPITQCELYVERLHGPFQLTTNACKLFPSFPSLRVWLL